MKIRIAPSLLSADFSCLAREVEAAERAGADLIHLDIMDGHFVPEVTFGPLVVTSLAPHCHVPLDAHLMVNAPAAMLEALAAAHVSRVAVHVEACVHLHSVVNAIQRRGIEAGVAINPATSLHLLSEVLDLSDFFLVMSVNPGYGGQSLISECIAKIERLRRMIGPRPLDITVDGGVDVSNARRLVEAGATTLVAGSAVFGAVDRAQALTALRQAAEEGATE